MEGWDNPAARKTRSGACIPYWPSILTAKITTKLSFHTQQYFEHQLCLFRRMPEPREENYWATLGDAAQPVVLLNRADANAAMERSLQPAGFGLALTPYDEKTK